jgi:type IV pilus assembly protein PilN
MARINLLPWREARRKEQRKQFASLAVFAAALTVVLVGFVHIHMNGLIEYQARRNAFLENEIKILDEKIKEIRKLESTKKALLERMAVIENLQATRPGVVHLFDELVKTLPEGTYLTKVAQKGSKLIITGKAESNARVSAYMRNIEASEWLDGAKLDVIQTTESGPLRISDFQLEARQSAPKPDGKGTEG